MGDNPFKLHGFWWWTNEQFYVQGPYQTEKAALAAMQGAAKRRTLWAQFITKFWEFVRS